MTNLFNVTEIQYIITDEKLKIKHDNGNQEDEFETYLIPGKSHGQSIIIKRNNAGTGWDLTIEPNLVGVTNTEIQTTIKNKDSTSKIDFGPFNQHDLTSVSIIGVDDIRDGFSTYVITFDFSKSRFGIKTNKNNTLILRKEHYKPLQ